MVDEKLARRKLKSFQRRCVDYGETARRLASHAALPVALNVELVHLLRINFFLDPPERLPYTAESDLLLSSLCREIGDDLYEIEPELRNLLLRELARDYGQQRIRDVAMLLLQYVKCHSPWTEQVELERAQQLTALNFLSSKKARQWLEEAEKNAGEIRNVEREWFVAMRHELLHLVQIDKETFKVIFRIPPNQEKLKWQDLKTIWQQSCGGEISETIPSGDYWSFTWSNVERQKLLHQAEIGALDRELARLGGQHILEILHNGECLYQFVPPVPLENQLRILIEQVRSRCCDKIQNLYSKIQLLNLQQIDVERLYVDVYVLETPSYISHATISDLLKVSDLQKNFDLLGLGERRERSQGLEAAKQYKKLMVLGKPGSGKSTFLRHIAIACCKGEFLPDYIPIFIELKNINASNFNLFNEIAQEFELDNEEETKKLLKNGEVLILLDGLDEVPSQFRQTVQNNIGQFSQEYYQNRFILTCRTQTTEYRLSNFEYIEVADFNSEQVEFFVNNWFSTTNENPEEKNQLTIQFIEKLRSPENKQIAELAVTPILLSLVCWAFSELRQFPSKRSDLYKEGINLLLAKWDETKGIRRDSGSQIYREMPPTDRQKLLSHIAARKFEEQQYTLFEESEIKNYIAEYLGISTQEAEKIPKTIEAEHGLLVERAKRIYSFSNLTFQEFLTAQYIVDKNIPVKELVEKHLTDSRWREVFLLLAELKQADDLLLAMERQIQTYVNSPKLQEFLEWVDEKSKSVNSSYKLAAIRAFYYDFALAGYYAPKLFRSLASAIDPKFNIPYYINLKQNHNIELELALDRTLTPAIVSQKSTKNSAKYLVDALNNVFEVELFNNPQFKNDNDLKQALQKHKAQLPEDAKHNTEWWQKNGQTWREQLREIMIEYRNIGRNWKFDNHQQKLLEQYYHSNKLLVDCLHSACIINDEVRKEIEETLLLPIAAIKKLKQSKSSSEKLKHS